MQKLWVLGAALACLALSSMPAFAGHHHRCGSDCCPPPCDSGCTTTVTWVDKEVTCYRTEMKWRDVPYTAYDAVPHDVVTHHQCTVMTPYYKDVKQTYWVNTCVPHDVVRDVTCCRMVPCTVVQPACDSCCDSCCYTVCKPEYYTQQVHCVQYENVPVKKECMVHVCEYKPVVKNYDVHQTVCEYKPRPSTRREYYCVTVPYVTHVKVAVCVPVCVSACCP